MQMKNKYLILKYIYQNGPMVLLALNYVYYHSFLIHKNILKQIYMSNERQHILSYQRASQG